MFPILAVQPDDDDYLGTVEPTPLVVWQEPEQPDMRYHIVLSGHCGDVPQTAISCCAIHHSGERGCPRCFIMGTQTAADGTALRATRVLGYSDTAVVDGFTVEDGHAAEFCYEKKFTREQDGVVTFDRDEASDAVVTDCLQRIRARTARIKAAAAAVGQGNAVPLPIPVGSSREEHEAHCTGTVSCLVA